MAMIDVRRWTGSLVTSIDQEETQPGDFSVLKNFIYDDTGLPTVRGGRRKWNSSAISSSQINGLYHYRSGWISGIQNDFLIALAGTKVYKAENDRGFDEILDGIEETIVPSFCSLRGWLIFCSGSEKFPRTYYWDQGMSEMRELSNAPNGVLAAAHANRLWIVDRDYPSRLWYSAPFEANNWQTIDGAGFLIINPGDGNTISALVPGFAGEMIVFKDGAGGGATYRVQGLAQPFSVSPLSQSVGAINGRCATMIGDKDIFFASRRGIHSLQRVFEHGDLETSFIDYEVSDRWRSIPDHSKELAVAIDDYPHDTWWLFVDTDGDYENDTGWLFNYRHRSPRGYPKISDVDYGASAATIYRDVRRGQEDLITGGYEYAYREHSPEANDDGTDYDWEAQLAPIDGGESFSVKSWRDLWLKHENWGYGDFSVTWFGDNRPPSSTTITLNPADAKVPFLGGVRVNEIRGFPPGFRSTNLVHLREGGVSLNVQLSGTRGRIRLRGMRLNVDPGRADINAERWFRYQDTQARA